MKTSIGSPDIVIVFSGPFTLDSSFAFFFQYKQKKRGTKQLSRFAPLIVPVFFCKLTSFSLLFSASIYIY